LKIIRGPVGRLVYQDVNKKPALNNRFMLHKQLNVPFADHLFNRFNCTFAIKMYVCNDSPGEKLPNAALL
jgi:hypothetical protein